VAKVDINEVVSGETLSGVDNLYGWPFILFFNRVEFNRYWNAHVLAPQGLGFSAANIEFEIKTSTQSTEFFRCALGPSRLQMLGGEGRPARLVVRRKILSCVNLHLYRSLGAPKRMVTEVRHILEEQGIELCLEIDIDSNVGVYESEGGVALGWANNPVFYLSSTYDGSIRDELGALPYALYFKGRADSDKFVQLDRIHPLSDNVLKPLHFQLRSVDPESTWIALHPLIEPNGGVFPITYPPIPESRAGVSIVLDTRRYSSLNVQDIHDCPSLLLPAGLMRGGAWQWDGAIVKSAYEPQTHAHTLAQPEVEGEHFGLTPLVRVINGSDTVALKLLPSGAIDQPPLWWSQYDGRVDAEGWACTFIPRNWLLSSNDGDAEPAEQETLGIERVCEYCVVQASVGSSNFTSTIVVLRGAPSGYFRAELGGGIITLKLCYQVGNEEVAVPLSNISWNGHNCFINGVGKIEPFGDEPFCIVRAHDTRNEHIWAVLVLPVPLVDAETVLSFGIA
jgi:hypothetical protein